MICSAITRTRLEIGNVSRTLSIYLEVRLNLFHVGQVAINKVCAVGTVWMNRKSKGGRSDCQDPKKYILQKSLQSGIMLYIP